MKRKGNLYKDICNVNNIIKVFDEVCRNTKNKGKVYKYKKLKCLNVFRIYDTLINKKYVVGPYNKFTIYEPKKRDVVSQQMFDKVINHLVARHILMPSIEKCLIDSNVASRVGRGTSLGIKYYFKYNSICSKNFEKFYILKCDIKSFFASIDHDILKEKLKRKIKDKDALKIVFDIIDSDEKGLGIGNMTSQIFAIFYLDDFDKFVKEKLKIKYYVRYQDDFLLWYNDKEYLRYCLVKIREFLLNERLELNKKTRIFSSNENFIYLGRSKFNKKAHRRTSKRKVKGSKYLYWSGEKNLMATVSSINALK